MQDYQKWQVEFEEVLNKDFTCLSRPTVKNLIHLVFALIMLLRTREGMVRENLLEWDCQNFS